MAPRLLWKPANKSTLKVLRGEFRGQYHIVLGRTDRVAQFFSGLPEVIDHKGLRIDFWTEPAPGQGGEAPPWRLTVRRMSEDSARPMEWYVSSQQPGSSHPLWRPGVGPEPLTVPDVDRVILLRMDDDRFFAGWLRPPQVRHLPEPLRGQLGKNRVGTASLRPTECDAILEQLEQEPEAPQVLRPEDVNGAEPWVVPISSESAFEGQPVVAQHVRRERSRRLRRAKIQAAEGKPICEACAFDFETVYGERGRGFVECHHLIPVSQLDPASPTRLDDLALLCANCHRMVHASRPWIDLEELRELLA